VSGFQTGMSPKDDFAEALARPVAVVARAAPSG
jgi:hypothetical protein